MIFTTAYTSSMVRSLTDRELVDLLVRSRARNAERGVTGLLLYRQGRVMQMLEGDEQVVRDLYDRIRMDVRHRNVTTVWSSAAPERRFPTWSMGFEDLDGVDRSLPGGAPLELPAEEPGTGPGLPVRVPAEQAAILDRRQAVLKRALVNGDRLVGALGIILSGHEPTPVPTSAGTVLQCRECRTHDEDALMSQYPCATAKNALWALEAVVLR